VPYATEESDLPGVAHNLSADLRMPTFVHTPSGLANTWHGHQGKWPSFTHTYRGQQTDDYMSGGSHTRLVTGSTIGTPPKHIMSACNVTRRWCPTQPS
jgi:hypothetical protein